MGGGGIGHVKINNTILETNDQKSSVMSVMEVTKVLLRKAKILQFRKLLWSYAHVYPLLLLMYELLTKILTRGICTCLSVTNVNVYESPLFL